ncbi:MAG: lysophospholipid acyltransferase family protein [Verrucomicrobiota bacterium]
MSSHPKVKSARFKGFSKWCQYVLARMLITVFQNLPMAFNYHFGRSLGWVFWKILKRRRDLVRKNLSIIHEWMYESKPDALPSMEMEEQVREIFMRSGANLFCGFSMSKMEPERLSRYLKIEGHESLVEGFSAGGGVILLAAHMGPWEAMTNLCKSLASRGIKNPTGSMYRPLNNVYLDRWYKSQREALGTKMFSRNDGFHKPVDFLRTGSMLGILADQRTRQGVSVPFFGKLVKTLPLPGLFMRRSGSVMVSMSLVTLGRMRWRLRYQLIEFPKGADIKSRAVCATIANEALERALSSSILDGFWFHDRFRPSKSNQG